MKIAVIGMLCEPEGASEGSVSWKWARAYRNLGHEVEIFTSASQYDFFRPEDLEEQEVRFLGTAADSDKSPHSVKQAFRLLRQIRRWNKQVADCTDVLEEFDLIHQVSLSTIRVPSSLEKLGSKLVWGPLGGAHPGYLKSLRGSAFLFEGIRNLSIQASFIRGHISGWFRRFSGLLLVTNSETEAYAKRLGSRFVQMELSDGVDARWFSPRSEQLLSSNKNQEIQISWAGRIVASKRPDLAVKALKTLSKDYPHANLTFYGEGPEVSKLRALAIALELEGRVNFPGRKDPALMPSIIERSDLCLFTSLRDSSSPFLLESLAMGIPCAAIRVQGVAACFPKDLVPGPGYISDEQQLVQGLVLGMKAALESDLRLERISFAKTHTWEHKAKRVLDYAGLTKPTAEVKSV